MFHANAWGTPHAGALIGCKQVLAGAHWDAESALDLLAREQVTRSAGVPVIWQGVLDALEREPGRWHLHPELRVNLGGAPAPEALFRRFDQQGIAVNMGWGMTEMTPVGTMNPHLGGAQRTRQGRTLPFIEARTAPDGELEVRGPWVADCYFGAISPESFTPDGWFRTGDIVAFDADGLMQIVDRAKDLIRSGGEWISSVALENALAAHPGIRDAAVIAVPHPKWQERPLALVVLREGAAADPAAWRRHLEAEFPTWQCPDEFRVLPALPRTPTGKTDKRALRAQFGGTRYARINQ
ncbi:MAG: AMP-binding enzyme, partial [Terriglobales bacterium]